MYITRLIFSFRYQSKLKSYGAVWCGIALTAISYFAVFKGLKGTQVIPADWMSWMEGHIPMMLGGLLVGWSLIMSILSMLKVNIRGSPYWRARFRWRSLLPATTW